MTKASDGIKGHEHGAAHHPGHGHAHSSGPGEFVAQVRALKGAEASAAAHIEEARKEASRMEAAARESAVEIVSQAQEKAVESKNAILAKKRGETDAEISSIVGAAKKQANAIRAKRLTDTDVAEISQDI